MFFFYIKFFIQRVLLLHNILKLYIITVAKQGIIWYNKIKLKSKYHTNIYLCSGKDESYGKKRRYYRRGC